MNIEINKDALEKELFFSGERFSVTYKLQGDKDAAYELAKYICNEETVEFPQELISDKTILENIIGRIESFKPAGENEYQAVISYAIEITGFELTQFLTVIFGNISLKPGILVERFDVPAAMLKYFKGPRFGQQGWRDLLDVHDRAILCTAIKPMGMSPEELADMTYKFASGGIDIIKDDHGLSNQSFCPYEERVKRCVEAIERANAETGGRSIYVPNVTASSEEVYQRAEFAARNGAGGIMICPAVTGFSAMQHLSIDDKINLPIMSHPTFSGSNLISDRHGFSYYCLMGQMQRLAGADASIHASYLGRFAFTKNQCRQVNAGCSDPLGQLKPIFPTPGGGMSIDTTSQLHDFYGIDVIFLVGGGLHERSPDLVENARYFLRMVKES